MGDTERRWLAETFYRLEAARWGLLRYGLPIPQRRNKEENWRPYHQENLQQRYAEKLPESCRLTTLTSEHGADLDGLLRGVSEYLYDGGTKLLPDDPG